MSSQDTKIYVALDLDDSEKAKSLARRLARRGVGFKVGPRLSLRGGPALHKELAKLGPLFIDHKFFDIPSTMEAAVRASFEAGASAVTVHAQAGPDALSRLAGLERELQSGVDRKLRILAVTVLTSFSQETLPELLRDIPIQTQVVTLARAVMGSGLSALVCSGEEVVELKRLFPDAHLVVPGVRLPSSKSDDQSRVVSPDEVFRRGAGAIVVGRPIVEASDPEVALDQFLKASIGEFR